VLVAEALVPLHMAAQGALEVLGGQLVATERLLFLVIRVAVAVRQAQPSLVTQTLLGKALALG